jgi:hypothetical protein
MGFSQTTFLEFQAAATGAIIVASDLGWRRGHWATTACLLHGYRLRSGHGFCVVVIAIVLGIGRGVEDEFGRTEADRRRRIGIGDKGADDVYGGVSQDGEFGITLFQFMIRKAWRRASSGRPSCMSLRSQPDRVSIFIGLAGSCLKVASKEKSRALCSSPSPPYLQSRICSQTAVRLKP